MPAIEFKQWLMESISNANSMAAAKLIQNYLQKKTGFKFMKMPGIEEFKNTVNKGFGIRYFYDGSKSIRFNWVSAGFKSSTLDSIDWWEGNGYDPKLNISFDHEASLVTVLPFVADMLSGPIKIGTFVAIPPDNLNEEVLNESYSDIFDGVVAYFKPQTKIPTTGVESALGSRGYKVLTYLRTTHPSLFSKQGRDVMFSGTQNDIDALKKTKDEVVKKLGGVKITVKAGGGNETYKAKAEHEAMDQNIEKIAYEDQLEDLKGLVRLTIKGASNALFVAGRGGTGKTHQVESTLNAMGLRDGAGYFKNAGSASAPGVYRVLFKNKEGIVLFDDSDGALADQDGRNILKAATDTKKQRKIAWNKASKNLMDPDTITDQDIEDGKLPTHFDFTGRIIFISNLSIDKLDPDGALRTRALMISIDPEDVELIKFLEKICGDIELEDGLDMSLDKRKEVVDLIAKNGKDINIRKLVRGLNIRAGAMSAGVGSTWERLIKLYA